MKINSSNLFAIWFRHRLLISILWLFTWCASAHSSVLLSLVNGVNTSSSNITSTPGGTVTLDVYATGLTPSQSLHFFDVTLIPSSGISGVSYTEMLSNWTGGGSAAALSYSAIANSSSFDLSSNVLLVQFNMSIDPALAQGVYSVGFQIETDYTDLYDSTSTPIAFTTSAVNITVVPEPGVSALFLFGAGLFLIRYARTKK